MILTNTWNRVQNGNENLELFYFHFHYLLIIKE